MISKTDEERYRYEMRMKAQRDYASGIEAAHQEGQRFGRIQLLQELLREAISTSAELRTWGIDRLTQMEESLQVRLRERN